MVIYPTFLRSIKDPIPVLTRVFIIISQFDSYENARNKIQHMIFQERGDKNHSIPLNQNFSIPSNFIFHQTAETVKPDQILIGYVELTLLDSIKDDPFLYEFLFQSAKLLDFTKYEKNENLIDIFNQYTKTQIDLISRVVTKLVIVS